MRAPIPIRYWLSAQRGHLFPWVPVMLAVGIGFYFSLRFEPSAVALGSCCVACFACAVAARWVGEGLRPLIVALVFVGGGFCLAAAHAHWVKAPVLTWRYYGPIEGRIVKIDTSNSDKPRITLDHVNLDRVGPDKTPKHVRVSLHGDQRWIELQFGQTVMMTGHLSPPQGPVEPDGFDFRRTAWFQALGAVGYTRTPVLEIEGPKTKGVARVYEWRENIGAHIKKTVGGETGAFAAAITTGDRSSIPKGTLDSLRKSNLAHLLAISGLHMGLLVGFIFGVVRFGLIMVPRIGGTHAPKSAAACAAIIGGGIYLALSGGAVATQRAYIMVFVMLVAVLLRKRALTLRAVAVAAVMVLVLDPVVLTGPGFQMSFAATTALVVVFGALRDWNTPQIPRVLKFPVGVLMSSMVAGLATAPFAAAHFNIVSHYGLLANVLSVPVMALLVMPAAVVAALLMPLGLDWIALWVMGQGIDWILTVANWVAQMPNSVGRIPAPQPFVLPLLSLGALVLVLWQLRGRWIGVLAMGVAFIAWANVHRPDILIADNGALIGVMTAEGRALSRAKGSGFVAQVWLENDADVGTQAIANTRGVQSRDGGKTILQHEGVEVIQLSGKKAAAAFNTCHAKQIVVANADLAPNTNCLVLDPSVLRDTGAWALTGVGDTKKWVTVSERVGDRLWAPANKKRDPKGRVSKTEMKNSDQYVRINPTNRP